MELFKNNKAVFLLPPVLLIGLTVGSWGPREDLRAARKELAELRKQAPQPRETDSQMDLLTRFAKIPDRATAPRRLPAAEPPTTNTAETPASTNTAAADPRANRRPRRPISPEDLRARIDEAKELWKTRVDIARAQWIDKLKLTPEGTALFDETINAMNEKLYLAAQRFADTLAATETVTPETGVRAMNEMTDAMVETYDQLSALTAEAGDGETAQIELTDFIDPGVAEPLIGVQDKLENLPKARQGGRLFRP